jgi:hypothetical protein
MRATSREIILGCRKCPKRSERWGKKMYYRVAIQVDTESTWQWKSTVLSSLDTLFQFLRLLRALPQDHLRVFSSATQVGLAEQLEGENKGLEPHSVTAAQFLRERMIRLPSEVRQASEREGGTSLGMVPMAVISQQPLTERVRDGSALQSRSMSALERRREELERGLGGDSDIPYTFSLPLSLPQVFAWITLLARVYRGELQS